ncbi:MAG: hypothetical protein ABJA89_01895, partial [Lapillicoccus sp.]
DLVIEVGDDRGSTTARLTSEPSGLVLEVPDPATLLRCVPGRGLSRDLPVSLPAGTFADLPVRLTSGGRDLGRVHLSPTGGIRLRPSWSGVPTVARTALSYGPGRVAAAGVVGVVGAAVALVAYRLHRRHQAR